MHRCQDAKRHGLLRFELFKKIDKFLSLNFRNILISPLEREIKFNPLTKREGSDSVIISNFFDTNHSQLTTHNSLIPDIVFSRFTSLFSLNRKAAFTLAEVLITLGIIGIVAALTLPVIISDVKNSQLEAGLKKAYSVLGQALNMYQAENGERIIAGDATNSRMIKSYLMQYIKSAKGINDNYCSNTSTHNMNGAGCTNSALMNKNFFKKLPR